MSHLCSRLSIDGRNVDDVNAWSEFSKTIPGDSSSVVFSIGKFRLSKNRSESKCYEFVFRTVHKDGSVTEQYDSNNFNLFEKTLNDFLQLTSIDTFMENNVESVEVLVDDNSVKKWSINDVLCDVNSGPSTHYDGHNSSKVEVILRKELCCHRLMKSITNSSIEVDGEMFTSKYMSLYPFYKGRYYNSIFIRSSLEDETGVTCYRLYSGVFYIGSIFVKEIVCVVDSDRNLKKRKIED